MISTFIYLNVSFVIRMVIIFTIMMKYYNWVIEQDTKFKIILWNITEWPFKAFAAIFFVLDIMYNWVMSLYSFELPSVWDETVSNRLKRWIKMDGVKKSFARLMQRILNFSDPGHI